jgi:acylglycerol lipase
MYDNFVLNKSPKLVGYVWDVESPNHVMCIIHGVGEYAGRYDRMAKVLGAAGIAVLSMDLRGHGLSDGRRGDTAPRTDVFSDIDLMLAEAERRWPGVPVVLYGHSMGGNIGLDYRARGGMNDVPQKFIISAPWIRLANGPSPKLMPLFKAAAKVAPMTSMKSGCDEKDLGDLEMVRPYAENPLVHPFITLRTAYDCMSIGEAIYKGRNETNHRADGKPFLLMHGSADKICDVNGSRAVAARLQGTENFRFIEWDGYYHEIHNGGGGHNGDEVIAAIRDFILE